MPVYVSQYKNRWRISSTTASTVAPIPSLMTVATVPSKPVALAIGDNLREMLTLADFLLIADSDVDSEITTAMAALPAPSWYLHLPEPMQGFGRMMETVLRLPAPYLGAAAADGVRDGLRRVLLQRVEAVTDPRYDAMAWRAIGSSPTFQRLYDLDVIEVEINQPLGEGAATTLDITCLICKQEFDGTTGFEYHTDEERHATEEMTAALREVADHMDGSDDEWVAANPPILHSSLRSPLPAVGRADEYVAAVEHAPEGDCPDEDECACGCHQLVGYYPYHNAMAETLAAVAARLNASTPSTDATWVFADPYYWPFPAAVDGEPGRVPDDVTTPYSLWERQGVRSTDPSRCLWRMITVNPDGNWIVGTVSATTPSPYEALYRPGIDEVELVESTVVAESSTITEDLIAAVAAAH